MTKTALTEGISKPEKSLPKVSRPVQLEDILQPKSVDILASGN